MDIKKLTDTLFEIEERDYEYHNRALQFFYQVESTDSYYVSDFQKFIDEWEDEDFKNLLQEIQEFPVFNDYDLPESYLGEEINSLICEEIHVGALAWLWRERTKSNKKKFF